MFPAFYFTDPAVTVLNSITRDCPGQKHDAKGRWEPWRAGRTKTITKTAAESKAAPWLWCCSSSRWTQIYYWFSISYCRHWNKAPYDYKCMLLQHVLSFSKRGLFFCPPLSLGRSCILKGHQLLKKSHIVQNVFLRFKVTVRGDREGSRGLSCSQGLAYVGFWTIYWGTFHVENGPWPRSWY